MNNICHYELLIGSTKEKQQEVYNEREHFWDLVIWGGPESTFGICLYEVGHLGLLDWPALKFLLCLCEDMGEAAGLPELAKISAWETEIHYTGTWFTQ